MGKKSEFNLSLAANAKTINEVMQQFLRANGFTNENKGPGVNYWHKNDMAWGKRSLEFYIRDSDVKILAYIGTYEKSDDLEGLVGAMSKQHYRNELEPLFDTLNKLTVENGASGADTAPVEAAATETETKVDFTNEFKEANEKKNAQMANWSFILSIFTLLCSAVGISASIILFILQFYMATQGLKSEKKKKAKAAIVMGVIAIVWLVLQILFL